MGQVRVWVWGVPMVAGGGTALGGFEFEELRSLPNASAARQWWKHCITEVSACKAVFHINVDATAVCLFQRHGRGKVFLAKKRQSSSKEYAPSSRTYLREPCRFPLR